MGFWEDVGEGLFGTETKKKADAAQAAAAQGLTRASNAAAYAGQAAAGVGGQAREMTQGARQLGQGYDQGTAQSMGANAADYMSKAQENAQGLASQQAQQAATQGAQNALRTARSSGLNAGQAALTSGQQVANTYQNALTQGTQQGIQNYMGATGQFAGQGAEMAGRAQTGIQGQLGATSQQLGAAGTQGQLANAQGQLGAQQQAQANQTAQNTWGSIMNAAGTIAPMVASDEACKKNIESLLDRVMGNPKPTGSTLDAILAKIDPVKFDYKNEPDGMGHLGVIAQDVEKTPLANVVKDTPAGKAIDPGELSTSNLALILELGKRLQALEGSK